MNSLDGEIRDGRHIQPVRVYYEDTDFSGIVYHASYLRFMERGRTNYLRLIGADHRALFEAAEKEAPGFSFVVRHMGIDFRKPALMDDVLDIVTTPEEVKGASVMLHQQRHARRRPDRRGACAGRLRVRRPRPADPQAAAHRHEGRSGSGWRQAARSRHSYWSHNDRSCFTHCSTRPSAVCGIVWSARGVSRRAASGSQARQRPVRASAPLSRRAETKPPPPSAQHAIDGIVALLRGEPRDLSAHRDRRRKHPGIQPRVYAIARRSRLAQR